MHLQPLYRRGPDWGHRILSAQWPTAHTYGPPIAHEALPAMDHVREFDCRMFALYFLLTESLATYLGYRITQHLLRGRGLVIIPPSLRVWIVFSYCALKIKLIDYAFHGSLYLIVSTIIAFCFALCTLLAIVFHFGPLQFIFADFRRRSGRFSCYDLITELKMFILKQHFHEYVREITMQKHDAPRVGPVATALLTVPNNVAVPWPLLGELELNVKVWNEWFVQHAFKAVTATAAKKKTLSLSSSSIDGLVESRFVVVMLPCGLLLDILLRPATASIMYLVRREDAYPFELIVRRQLVPDSLNDRRFYFCYAQCTKLAGSASRSQKLIIHAMLVQLNSITGLRIDVPLRALRCQNFIEANCHEGETFRRIKHRRNLSSQLESAFG